MQPADVSLAVDVEQARWQMWLMESEAAMTADADAGVHPLDSWARTVYLARLIAYNAYMDYRNRRDYE